MSRLFQLRTLTFALMASATQASAEKIKFDFWYGNTRDAVANQCKLFNASQDKYEVNCTGQGGYERLSRTPLPPTAPSSCQRWFSFMMPAR